MTGHRGAGRFRHRDAAAHWARLAGARRQLGAPPPPPPDVTPGFIRARLVASVAPPGVPPAAEHLERLAGEWAPDTLKITTPHLYADRWAVQLWCEVLAWSHEQRRGIASWQSEMEDQ